MPATAASLSLRRHLMAFGALVALMFAHLSVAAPSLPAAAADAEAIAAASAAALRDLASLGNAKTAARNIPMMRGQAVIAAVPEEARGAFIFYQLAAALNATNNFRSGQPPPHPQTRFAIDAAAYGREAAAFRSVPVYDDFAEELLHWALQHFGLTEADIYGLMRSNHSNYCTANGVCYSQEDISCVCCPF